MLYPHHTVWYAPMLRHGALQPQNARISLRRVRFIRILALTERKVFFGELFEAPNIVSIAVAAGP